MNDAFAETDVPRADTARSYAAAAGFLAVSVLGLEAAVAGFAEAPATDLWAHDSLPRVVTAVVFGLALHAWSRRRAERDEPPISVRARRVLLAGYLTAAALVVLATSGAMPVLDRSGFYGAWLAAHPVFACWAMYRTWWRRPAEA